MVSGGNGGGGEGSGGNGTDDARDDEDVLGETGAVLDFREGGELGGAAEVEDVAVVGEGRAEGDGSGEEEAVVGKGEGESYVSDGEKGERRGGGGRRTRR